MPTATSKIAIAACSTLSGALLPNSEPLTYGKPGFANPHFAATGFA